MITYETLYELLKKEVQSDSKRQERFEHSLRVVEMALDLNRHHGLNLDENKIKIAALVHDYAKMIDEDKYRRYFEKALREADEDIQKSEATHHALLLGPLLKEDLQIFDEEIIDAAMFHCTGKENMGHLTKLIFVSDYIETGRTYSNCVEVRKIAFIDFEQSIYEALKRTMEVLTENDRFICKYTEQALNEYRKKMKS